MRSSPVRGLRWWIIGLVFLATLINFIDRLTIVDPRPGDHERSCSSPTRNSAASPRGFSSRIPPARACRASSTTASASKRGFTLSVLVWSMAASAHAFARGLHRPARASRSSSAWAKPATGPARRRSSPSGSRPRARVRDGHLQQRRRRRQHRRASRSSSGCSCGSDGRRRFSSPAVSDFGWLLLWLRFYETPERHATLTPDESRLIHEGRAHGHCPTHRRGARLLEHRQTWAIVARADF